MIKDSLPTAYYINPKSLVDYSEVCQILKISRRSLQTLMKNKQFPPPFVGNSLLNINKQKKRWVYQDVMDWIEKRKNGIHPLYEQNIKLLPTIVNLGEEAARRRKENKRRGSK